MPTTWLSTPVPQFNQILNHYSWIYVGDAGHSHKVGLYHGSKSGHVLIYVGRKVVVIDFKVFESKKYTFFIEDELVRVCLQRKGDEMYYTFEIDKTADTPRNRARRIVERKYLRQFLLTLGVLIGLVLFAVLVLPSFSEKTQLSQTERLVLNKGTETVATIVRATSGTDQVLRYQFISGNDIIEGSLNYGEIARWSPMPVQNGDEFVLSYVPARPHLHSIFLNRPTEKQIERFKNRAAAKHLKLHPEENSETARCLVNTAYLLSGLDGIADFFYQDLNPAINPKHNSASFEELTQSLSFRKKAAKACRQ